MFLADSIPHRLLPHHPSAVPAKLQFPQEHRCPANHQCWPLHLHVQLVLHQKLHKTPLQGCPRRQASAAGAQSQRREQMLAGGEWEGTASGRFLPYASFTHLRNPQKEWSHTGCQEEGLTISTSIFWDFAS